MKLATLNDGTPDGALFVVSRDLMRAAPASAVVSSLRLALESWDVCSPQLRGLASDLENGDLAGTIAFDALNVAAPLPRAPQFLDGSVFLSHGKRMVKAFKLSTASLEVDHPLMYQGASDAFLGAHAAMPLPSEEHGIDIEAELAIVTGAVPMGISSTEAVDCIRLVTIFDDVSLRRLLFAEMSLGFGMIQSKPTCIFAPAAVTPDELGEAWRDARLHLRMRIHLNDQLLGDLSTSEMGFSFGEIIAHAARTRTLSPGTVVGSGTVSNEDCSKGTACVAERRALETLEHGAAKTDWLKFGDRVRIEVVDEAGNSVFGAIDHTFVAAPATGAQ
jgi:fumarylacetoacetate (FAA) hydrolase